MEKRTKHIAILHAHNTFNNGSFMMLINFIYYLGESLSDNSVIIVWIEFDGKENEERLFKALNNSLTEKIKIRTLPYKITSQDHSLFPVKLFRLFGKLFLHPRYFKKIGISAVIILGGDDISEYYKKWMIISDLYRIRRYSGKFKTILAGQTIGPFQGIREKIASYCLSNSYIFARDNKTTDYLLKKLQLNKERVIESVDLAFPDLPNQDKSDIMEQFHLISGKYICIVPGGFYSLYTQNKKSYISAWKKLVEELRSNEFLSDKLLVLLPHVTRPEDDRVIISELKKQISETANCIYIEDELMPHELRKIIGNGYFTISSRMHASISSFQMGIPAISIGFSVKYEGIIGNSLQCPGLIVHSSNKLFKESVQFTGEVMQKVQYLTNSYLSIKDSIVSKLAEMKERGKEQVNKIAEMISG